APDGRRLAGFPMIGKTLALQEIATAQKCLDLDPKQGFLFGVAFSPDGRTLATGGEDGTVALWDLPSGKELARLAGHRSHVKEVARLLADLDSNDFATRQKAMKELEHLGELVAPALRQALADRPSAEVKRQLELLLEALDGVTLSGEPLRRSRAVEALEMNAS